MSWVQPEPASTRSPVESRCDDPELIRLARHDHGAFAAIYDCFWSVVLRYSYLRLRSWPDAEDVAQVVFLRASRALPEFEQRNDGGGFRSWLIRIAHNEAISAARYRIRRPAVTYPAEDLIPDQTAGAEAALEAIALNDWLAELCDQLPDGQRDVLRLRFAGLTTDEIAVVLGKSAAAVRKATERATERLVELGKRDREHWHD